MSRLKYSIFKLGQLKELEQKDWINKLFKFQERNIKGCYKVMTKRYFMKNEFRTLKEIY